MRPTNLQAEVKLREADEATDSYCAALARLRAQKAALEAQAAAAHKVALTPRSMGADGSRRGRALPAPSRLRSLAHEHARELVLRSADAIARLPPNYCAITIELARVHAGLTAQ